MKEALTYDDVSLLPSYSSLTSKRDVSLGTKIGNLNLSIPICSAPMDSVTEENMARFIGRRGGIGFIHRYLSIESQVRMVVNALETTPIVGAAIGVNGDSFDRARELIENGANPIIFDVAHGHTYAALKRMEELKQYYPDVTFVSGNIATCEAAKDLEFAGADALRVGIGAGAACTTRIVAGVGVPQITAIMEIAETSKIPLIADGGIRKSGDIVKALAAGADAVILGGLLATFPVSAQPGVYRGMASLEALIDHKGSEDHIPEGEFFTAHVDEHYEETFDQLINGVRLGLSYLGAPNIPELQAYAEFVKVTSNGYMESLPHFKGGDF